MHDHKNILTNMTKEGRVGISKVNRYFTHFPDQTTLEFPSTLPSIHPTTSALPPAPIAVTAVTFLVAIPSPSPVLVAALVPLTIAAPIPILVLQMFRCHENSEQIFSIKVLGSPSTLRSGRVGLSLI